MVTKLRMCQFSFIQRRTAQLFRNISMKFALNINFFITLDNIHKKCNKLNKMSQVEREDDHKWMMM